MLCRLDTRLHVGVEAACSWVSSSLLSGGGIVGGSHVGVKFERMGVSDEECVVQEYL